MKPPYIRPEFPLAFYADLQGNRDLQVDIM